MHFVGKTIIYLPFGSRKLEEREALADRVRYLETRLAEKDEEIKLLARKNSLMEKNLKSQLALEHQKRKEIGHKYEISLSESGKSSSANIVEVKLHSVHSASITSFTMPSRLYSELS